MALESPRHQGAGAAAAARDRKNIILQKYLTECRSFYSCLYCRTHLANHDELISRSFQGNRGRAYLFNEVVNVDCKQPVQRELNTGSHAVADIYCTNCGTTIGWKYEKAYVESQKYKEGKFIIELAHVVRENRHLELDKRDMFLGINNSAPTTATSATLAAGSALKHTYDSTKKGDAGATIGQLHQGSLSPPSNSDCSGQWSCGGTSSSSNGDGSSAPGGSAGPRMIGFAERTTINTTDHDDELSDEEEEVLMFPFHDDLFGERASYSNLSSSRLSYKRRLRRSLNLDSAPYDWKYSARASPSLNSVANVDHFQTASSTSLPSPLAAASSSGQQQSDSLPDSQSLATAAKGPQAPSSTRNRSESSANEDDDDNENQDEDDEEIQFKLDPCDPARGSDNCDRSNIGEAQMIETAVVNGASASVSQVSTSHETLRPCGSSDLSMNLAQSSRTNSLSLDDEEFYDCRADH